MQKPGRRVMWWASLLSPWPWTPRSSPALRFWALPWEFWPSAPSTGYRCVRLSDPRGSFPLLTEVMATSESLVGARGTGGMFTSGSEAVEFRNPEIMRAMPAAQVPPRHGLLRGWPLGGETSSPRRVPKCQVETSLRQPLRPSECLLGMLCLQALGTGMWQSFCWLTEKTNTTKRHFSSVKEVWL